MSNRSNTKEGMLTMAAITIVNILNYALNLILGRWLGPVGFAEANIIATLVLVISFLGIAIQLSVANEISRCNEESRPLLLKWFIHKVQIISLVITTILVISSSLLASFLQLSSASALIILASGIPFYFTLSAKRGYLQGKQLFRKFAATYVIETIGRLLTTIILLYFTVSLIPQLNIDIIALGFLVSFISASSLRSNCMDKTDNQLKVKIELKPIFLFVGMITLYELSQILINNFDVILTKHFFDQYEAGIYASIALIGRIVYFGTWTIVTILFPKVIEKERNGESHSQLFYGALSLVASAGILITAGCYIFGNQIVAILFGEAYNSAVALVWQYALATTLFASANVFAYYYMSLKKYSPIFLSLIAGSIQIILIFLYHTDLQEVILMQIWVMSGLLISMILFHALLQFQKDSIHPNHEYILSANVKK